MGNVAIKLFKNDTTNKGIGINVADSTASINYALYVNGAIGIKQGNNIYSLPLPDNASTNYTILTTQKLYGTALPASGDFEGQLFILLE